MVDRRKRQDGPECRERTGLEASAGGVRPTGAYRSDGMGLLGGVCPAVSAIRISMEQGYLSLVLHCHLPFIRHPEHIEFLEEDWLFEAITETYIPLIQLFERLITDRVPFRITLSVTPTLAAMLVDPLLQERYLRHIHLLIELSEKEIRRTEHEPAFNRLARMYHSHFLECRRLFEDRYGRNLLTAFRAFQNEGHLEIITCAATHGFLPLMAMIPAAVRAQVQVGAQEYARHFGRPARGIWLPECGYYPGVDEFLAEARIRYFFIDTHGLLHAKPRPKFGVYAPIYCRSRVAAFARDIESSKQVWSAAEGYPGDYEYRDFYRDIGFDLDFDYIKPHLPSPDIRGFTGIKYYKITGSGEKQIYQREDAVRTADEHAQHFLNERVGQVQRLTGLLDRPPL